RKHVLLISSGLIAALSTIALYSLAVNALDLEIPDGMEFLDEGLWLRISGIFLVIIVAPITEEIFFRGFVFGGLNRNIGFVAATIVSAGLFALLHVHPMVYVPIFLIGLLLAWVYARSGSLWTSIHLHMAYNATIIGVNL
ncbi:CPBP family intramembrane metalloprotease, partial [Dehalococcoidia bacterium]|nr:CPBP family intramembrane metalloprotease [Dehalococcoidia bacterium]